MRKNVEVVCRLVLNGPKWREMARNKFTAPSTFTLSKTDFQDYSVCL